MSVRTVEKRDREDWLRLRAALWPGDPDADLLEDVDRFFRDEVPWGVFVAEVDGDLVGFVECSLHEKAPGCTTSPIGYVEGWYVEVEHRRRGVGRALIAAAESWAREAGAAEMASDTTSEYPLSPGAHEALGFEETKVRRHYRKTLESRSD